MMFQKQFRHFPYLSAGLLFVSSISLCFPAQPISGAEDAFNSGEKIEISVVDKPLTEAVLVDMTIKNSRKLQSMSTNVDIANYRLKSARNIPNPELRLTDITTRNYKDDFDELRIGMRFRLPGLGEMGEDRQDATVSLGEQKNNELIYRQELIADVRRDYFSVILHDKLKELSEKRVGLEDRRIKIIEEMVAVGSRSIVYYTKAKMRHADSVNDYAREVQSQIEARRKLSRRTGMNIDCPLEETDLPEVALGLDRLIEIACKNRPEIQLVAQRIELAMRQNKREHLKVLPWFNFIELNYHVEANNKADWGELMMGIDIPLFNWNRGNIKAATLAVKKKEIESDAVKETIGYEVNAAYTVYRDLLLDWKNFSRESETLIAEAAQVIEQAKQHQTLLMDEVMEMELTILETQEMLAQKKKDLADALLDLCITVGVEDYATLQN
ncbi:MAG: TolC family protein [Candidatus Neomarinimicrobiota bacterium]